MLCFREEFFGGDFERLRSCLLFNVDCVNVLFRVNLVAVCLIGASDRKLVQKRLIHFCSYDAASCHTVLSSFDF